MSWAEIKKAINSDLATEPLNTKTDRIEADTQSIESKVDIIDTNVDDIETNIGSNSDSASATGSVHAKLKDIKNYGFGNNINFAQYYNATCSQDVWQTVLNKTSGGATLYSISVYNSQSVIDTKVRITIDGVAATLTNNSANYALRQDNTSNPMLLSLNVRAETSLKIEFANTNASSSIGCCVAIYST